MKLPFQIENLIRPAIEKGLNASFFKTLSKGTLGAKQYSTYLLQDSIYLSYYKLALVRIADSSNDINEKLFFEVVAKNIQNEPSTKVNTPSLLKANKPCLRYIDYLMEHTMNGPAFSIASIFPCFYFYYVMAKTLKTPSENTPYYDWFACYTSPSFISDTEGVTALINHYFLTLNEKDRWLNVIKEGFDLEYEFHQFDQDLE
jgi:thiaminase